MAHKKNNTSCWSICQKIIDIFDHKNVQREYFINLFKNILSTDIFDFFKVYEYFLNNTKDVNNAIITQNNQDKL